MALEVLQGFLSHSAEEIGKPKDLAVRMARLTQFIHGIVLTAIQANRPSQMIADLRQAFAETLIPDLDSPRRLGSSRTCLRRHSPMASSLRAATTTAPPGTFLSRWRGERDPEDEPVPAQALCCRHGTRSGRGTFAGFVDDLVQVLSHTDIEGVLAGFREADEASRPVVHFYETFLAAYDPKAAGAARVYYTPEPVVPTSSAPWITS